MTQIEQFKSEINTQVSDPSTLNTLLATTFKGLNAESAKRAMLEGMIRGFSIQNFLEKDIYAIPFKDSYTLITSIDWARKVGMRSGIVGKLAPVYEEKDGKIISCTMTVKRRVNEYVGEYSATAFFDEYYKAGKNGYPSLWDTKPRTMIAKVCEMHALRMACPEELSKAYVEEEFQQTEQVTKKSVNLQEFEEKLKSAKTLEELKTIWISLPPEAKTEFENLKTSLKSILELQKSIDGQVIENEEKISQNSKSEAIELSKEEVEDIAKEFDGKVVQTNARKLMEEGKKRKYPEIIN